MTDQTQPDAETTRLRRIREAQNVRMEGLSEEQRTRAVALSEARHILQSQSFGGSKVDFLQEDVVAVAEYIVSGTQMAVLTETAEEEVPEPTPPAQHPLGTDLWRTLRADISAKSYPGDDLLDTLLARRNTLDRNLTTSEAYDAAMGYLDRVAPGILDRALADRGL